MYILKHFAIIIAFLCINNENVQAQLRKAAEIEKVKSFTNGSVPLYKTKTDLGEIYSVAIPNNSKFHEAVVFYLGTKEELLKNLQDLSTALAKGKKGDVFEFSACGKDYNLVYRNFPFGGLCFDISTPISASSDFGRFYKMTIDDILEYFQEDNK